MKAVIYFILLSISSQASEIEGFPLFHKLPENFARSFTGYRLGLQAIGIAATPPIIYSNLDAVVYRSAADGKFNPWTDPAVYAAIVLPPLVGGGLYLSSKLFHDDDAYRAAFAGLQASLVAITYISTIKFFTGRLKPGQYGHLDEKEQSRIFHFGFGREGIISGWPSGHTVVTAALGSSIANYYDLPTLWFAGSVATAYMAVGMTLARKGSEHWLSDTVTALFMGYAIGSSVGDGFKKKDPAEIEKPKSAFLPFSDGKSIGLQYSADLSLFGI